MSFWLRKYIGEILLESSTGRVRNLSQEELVSLVDSLLGNEGDLVSVSYTHLRAHET